jgi:hypothetical protein
MMERSDEMIIMMSGRHDELLLYKIGCSMMESRLRTQMPAPDDTEPAGR